MNFPSDLLECLRSARRVTVLTGSGIPAESGIPTFREAQNGLWERYSPEELASPQGFQKNPHLVWDWYAWRRQQLLKVKPNPGHIALAHLEKQVPEMTLITQNVDGLHQAAGSHNVLELHGNLSRVRCSRDGSLHSTWSENRQIPPPCPECGAPLRPDVIWFGETLPQEILVQANQASRDCDLFFSIGTSSLVYPAASMPIIAIERGIVCVEVNLQSTPITSSVSHHLRGTSGVILPALFQGAWPGVW